MRHMLKVLLITIVGLFVGNVDGTQSQPQTIFDLPDNTPGLMTDTPSKNVCGQQKNCVHVIIPQTEAYKAYTDDRLKTLNSKERAEHACSADGNIYFPVDGTQPTSKEAGEYSCANVDAYDENSPITNWYMEVFGYRKKIKAGWGFNNEKYNELLCLCKNLNKGEHISDFWGAKKIHSHIIIVNTNTENAFWKQFKIIASNPVGRVLLYRILIEIRRHVDDWGVPESGIDIQDESDILLRNWNRSIQIKFDNFYFNATARNIGFTNINEDLTIFKIVNNSIQTDLNSSTQDICLFHELLHWYLLLRDPSREKREHNIAKHVAQTDFLTNPYYGEDPLFTFSGGFINVPELRVILGMPDTDNSKLSEYIQDHITNVSPMEYYRGDDLSENAYRCSISYHNNIDFLMRWGHSDVKLVEKLKKANIERFLLAYRVAILCFCDIIGKRPSELDRVFFNTYCTLESIELGSMGE